MLNEDAIEAVGEWASQKEINPFGNIHTSPDFQRHLARVLTRKTLKQAIERAGTDGLQFLKQNPNPTEDEIRHALSGNLCRCTGYQQIVDAVKLAAEKMR